MKAEWSGIAYELIKAFEGIIQGFGLNIFHNFSDIL